MAIVSAPRANRSWWRWGLALLGKTVLALLTASVLAVFVLRWVPLPTSAFMLERRAAAWWDGRDGWTLRYEWVGWDAMSPHPGVAVIAAEDQKFAEHHGFDFESIGDAWEGIQNGRRFRGASTISQQVAKNLFLWSGPSFVRKGIEAYFTVLIELGWSKRRILEVYLNIAEFGDGVFGVGAAAPTFFGKSASQITADEAALLAAVLPNPIRLRVDRPSAYVFERQAWIRGQMGQLGGTGYLKSIVD